MKRQFKVLENINTNNIIIFNSKIDELYDILLEVEVNNVLLFCRVE